MNVGFTSVVRAQLIENGKIVEERFTENLLTEGGEALIADQLSDRGQSRITHMAIGTGGGQSRTDTILDNQVQRVALDSAGYPVQGTGNEDNDVIMVATFPATSAYQITEGGCFNDVTAGTMLNWFEFSPPITKSASQSLVLTVTMTCGFS